MSKVMQPIRDKQKILLVKDWLLMNRGIKYSFLFTFGVNTGLRVSDILSLKAKDVRNKKVVYLVTHKTNRQVEVHLNSFIQKEIENYIQFKEDKDYLFTSREGVNRPLTRQMVSQVFKKCGEILEIDNFNTHTMRKSFGYWYYKENRDVYYLMKLFGHNSQFQTLDYIGIESDEISKTIAGFSLGEEVVEC